MYLIYTYIFFTFNFKSLYGFIRQRFSNIKHLIKKYVGFKNHLTNAQMFMTILYYLSTVITN